MAVRLPVRLAGARSPRHFSATLRWGPRGRPRGHRRLRASRLALLASPLKTGKAFDVGSGAAWASAKAPVPWARGRARRGSDAMLAKR